VIAQLIFRGAYLVSLAYFVCVIALFFYLITVAYFENRRRMAQHRFENYGILASSDLTKPVSILIAALNEERTIADCVKSALHLDYPEFEVIVVNDGSADNTLAVLVKTFELEARDVFFRKRFAHSKINCVYRSKAYPRLTVIDKEPGGGKAGGLNVALDFSVYTHICSTDADTILEKDALLKAMRPVLRDPEGIVGVSSLYGIRNDFTIRDGRITGRRFSRFSLASFQFLEYIRSFIFRSAWGKIGAMPCVSGGFALWQKEFLYEIGGYSPHFTCEDMELTFRAHDHIIKSGSKRKIIMLPYIVAWTEGPDRVRNLVSQRTRWQRTNNETFFHYRHMLWNPRYGTVGMVMMPYIFFYEVLGAFVELAGIFLVVAGAVTGLLDTASALLLMMVMSFCYTSMTLAAIYIFDKDQRQFSTAELLAFVLMSFFEMVLYRPILAVARIQGTIDFLKQDKSWDRFDRVGIVSEIPA